MKYLVTGKEMKLLDQNTSVYFKVPELVLMEQAAMHFVWRLCDVLKEETTKKDCKGIVFCGLGNNGADGIAIARLLNERGIHTQVCKVSELLIKKGDTSPSYRVQEEIYQAYQYPVQNDIPSILNQTYDFVVDAVFGIGLSRPLNEEYISIIQLMQDTKGCKFAVDMPSGVNSDNGQIMSVALKCDYTITFSYAKLGLCVWPGNEFAGQIFVENIGITDASWLEEQPSMAYLEAEDLRLLPKRPAHSNKGTFGKLLVIAGSLNMAGAAIFAAKAAYRCGVGLVKIFTQEENRVIIQETLPEALLSTYGHNIDKEQLIRDMQWADAIVIGPGLGISAHSQEIVDVVHRYASVPVLWDADGLNVLSKNMQLLQETHAEYICTPHLGEFSRLIHQPVVWIQEHLVESAVDFAKKYDLICVLKDFRTVIANPQGMCYLNLSGNNGMATGGSGDVLAGIIGALLAQGLKGAQASTFGTFIHGLAGDFTREKTGTHSMLASDIIDALETIWKGIEYAEY